jgi:KaiC/GvpD/RAD55 family RecA-like ATPase
MVIDKLVRVKTGISQAYWCDTSGQIAEFQPAKIAFDTSEPQSLSWFDALFEGGLLLPEGNCGDLHPLTMLVSGPPGCGKTTLVTELCYRLAAYRSDDQQDKKQDQQPPLSTLYISTDAETGRMIQNAVDLGWDRANDYFIPFDPEDKKTRLKNGLSAMIGVWGREKFLASIDKQDLLSSMVEVALNSLTSWVLKANPATSLMKKLKQNIILQPMGDAVEGGKEVKEQYIPDILVIDSLNILNPEGKTEFFQAFVKACKARRLVIFMLNTGQDCQEHESWEYYSDIVVQLGHEYVHDYYVRTIEVVKARFQPHRWGKHQLKIYANPKGRTVPSQNDPMAVQLYNTAMRRAHPYRSTGGVFIFPSIHSYLSVYKHKTAAETESQSASKTASKPGSDKSGSDGPLRDETYPVKLNTIFQIPKGRCTAFIGQRGGHKSHLGYLHLLYRLMKDEGESGLVVSLREDEATTKATLARVALEEFDCTQERLNQMEMDNHLEILYFPPGYITPEEFFHRIFISVHRLKRRNNPLTVLFNSLDQISARFPLCAKQEIFIPGILQTLSGEGVTSICIAVDEEGQPVQQYGLLPMSDLIVSFSLRRFSAKNYYEHQAESWGKELDKDKTLKQKCLTLQNKANCSPDVKHEAVVLQVIRFSGGERAGARGILELVKKDDMEKFPYAKPGLHFIPMSEELPQGDPLSD